MPAEPRSLECVEDDETSRSVVESRMSRHVAPRILFAVFQTGRLANGGLESITAVITGIKDWQPIVVTNRETPFCERWRQAGAKVIVWDLPYEMGSSFRSSGAWGMCRRVLSMVRTNLQLFAWACRRQMTLIHCNDPAPFWHVAFAARFTGVPLVFNLRDTKSPEEGLDTRKYQRRFRWASRVLVISREMKAFYERALPKSLNPGATHIDHIYSAVDFSRMCSLPYADRRDLRQRLGIQPDTFAIGYIATFNDKKNQADYLRNVVPGLRKICPSARTYFVGDYDPERDEYARRCGTLVRDENLSDSVSFVGYTKAVEEWYQACDVIVVPTRKEGLARCMIEGLACGTPVVSFAVCSAREILEEYGCGVVVPLDDYPAMIDSICLLAKDANQKQEMQERAIEVTRRLFTSERMIDEYQKLYIATERKE